MQVERQRSTHTAPKSNATTQSLWEEVPCNLCGSKDSKIKFAGITDHDMERLLTSYSASGNFVSKETLVECRGCGLIYTSPRLRRDLILKSYTEAEDPGYVSQADGRIKSFERCMDAVEKYKTKGSILDIGAAAGFFLKVAKERGWRTYGIEPSQYLSHYGNKNYDANITCGTLETAPPPKEKLDVITLWDVLEHTFEPKQILQRCNRYLKDDGIIVINYPNIGNLFAKMAGKNYWFILSVHLYYFVPKTIASMLETAGFEVISSRPHFQFLQLGYLVYRLEAYLPGPAKLFGKFVKALGMGQTLIPYFAAQTRVIARKVASV